MANIIVFGGSKGLGKCIVNELLSLNHKVVSVSRSEVPDVLLDLHTHITFDLSSFDNENLDELFSKLYPIDAICFAQRYRPKAKPCAISEYNTSVQSVAKIIEYIDQHQDLLPENAYCRILLMGSSYSYSAGYDQSWSYHACKHALHGLLRFFSISIRNNLLFYMISPPTFVKEGAQEYWSTTIKAKLWKNFPSKGLIDIASVSKLCSEILLNGSPLMNGCNVITDAGISNLYQDQITLPEENAH